MSCPKRGKNKLIEGEILKDKNSLLVEDLMTDGKSKINFIKNIRSHEINCNLGIVVFKYNIFENADITLKKNNIEVHNLTDWEEVYNEICKLDKFGFNILTEIRKFLDDPVTWSNNKNQFNDI